MSDSDVSFISFDFLENSIRYTRCFSMGLTGWDSDGVPQTYYFTSPNDKGALGTSNRKWKQINGLNPSSLSLPDLANGIDISSYITIGDTDNNYFTPPVNGWIWVKLIGNGLAITQGDFGSYANYVVNTGTGEKWVETCLLVTKDIQATIRCRGITGIVGAKFYPCLGNV